MLFRKCIKPLGQQLPVQNFLEVSNPRTMKIVKGSGMDPSPVVYCHDPPSEVTFLIVPLDAKPAKDLERRRLGILLTFISGVSFSPFRLFFHLGKASQHEKKVKGPPE